MRRDGGGKKPRTERTRDGGGKEALSTLTQNLCLYAEFGANLVLTEIGSETFLIHDPHVPISKHSTVSRIRLIVPFYLPYLC